MTEHYKCNVLLVDDSCNNLAAMDNILKPIEDIGIYHALSDKEALEKIVHHDFSVVLLDANISGMDAYAFVKSLSNTDAHKHIPIVMVAEKNTSSQQDLRAYEAGAIDYITKPVDPLILQCKVKQFVAIKKLQAKNKYLQSEQEMILDVAGQGVIKICSEGTIQFVNKKTCQLMSAKSDAIIGTRLNQWFQWCDSSHCAPEDIFSYIHERVRRRGVYQQDDIKLRLESKKKVCIEITCTVEKNHSNSPMIILFQDVTARLESEQQLLNLANFDPLTHLANRSFFQDHLVRAIARARRLKSSVVLLALDLDRFKIINDTLGHDVGDELLTGVALRLKSQLRENDICARLGGDEFAVLLEDIGCVENAEEVARKIVRVIAEPFEIQGKEVLVEISIGIACCTGGQPEKRALCKWADIALYAAKAAGRNCFRRFIPTMSEKAEKQAFIQSQLRRMIENQALDIHYQAQYSLADNSIVGFEALARWPARGYGKTRVTPELFIPVAERSCLIQDVGEFILRRSCQLLEAWQLSVGTQHLTLALNLSSRQLNAPGFMLQLKNTLAHYTFPLHHLVFEITEKTVMDHPKSVSRKLDELKSMGLSLALDDFGTGFSSLNYLQNLPFDTIKIDQSFIHRLGMCKKTRAFIEAIMTIKKACNMDVVAEGVENLLQLNIITDLGCDKMQGFYFSKPVPVDKISSLLLPKSVSSGNLLVSSQ